MLLIIDNYDSFTFNLVQRLGEINPGLNMRVVRNDEMGIEDLMAMRPTHVIVSPGPCSPAEAGVSGEVVRRFAGVVPVLGVCLGHQCIGAEFGMGVVRAARPVHGLPHAVHHDGRGIYAGLPNPFWAARYHSLVVPEAGVPREGWEVSAWAEENDGEGRTRRIVMGLRRVRPAGEIAAPLDGVQFHPESFLTPEGPTLLRNFLGQDGGPVRAAAGAAGRTRA